MQLPHSAREGPDTFVDITPFGYAWTNYACPYCGSIFRRDFWPHNVKLGNGRRTCRHCRKVFDDGAREWPQLTLAKKLRFFFPPLLVAVCGGFELAGILQFFVAPRDEHSGPVTLVITLFVVLVVALLWSPVRLIWVLRSGNRYKRELLVSRAR